MQPRLRCWFLGSVSTVWLLCMAALPSSAQPPRVADDNQARDTDDSLAAERALLRMFADALQSIKSSYADDDITDRQLIEAAIRGMVSELDRYSIYIPPEQMERFRASVEKEFGGIGVQVSAEHGKLVLSPLFGTPAHRAGLMAGDQIIQINDQSTKGMSVDEAAELVKGEVGESVSLTVLHPHDGRQQTVSLKHEVIQLETVLGYQREADDEWDYWYDAESKIAYVRLTAFGRRTSDDLRDRLEQLDRDGLQALILDLRFNPGGLFSSAVETSNLFITEGVIVSTEGRNSRRREWTAQRSRTFDDFPMVVLVNRHSASASEIVAACLQDHKRAIVGGERTWGKGSVQSVIRLEGGRSVLKLTTGAYRSPNGRNIHRREGATDQDEWGVMPDPDYRLRLSREELLKLDAEQQRRSTVRNARRETESDQSADFVDRQLEACVAYLREHLRSEMPPAACNGSAALSSSQEGR